MPNINIVCIGSLKERWWQQAQAEYQKRLSAFCRLKIVEKKEAALPKNASAALIEKAREEESASLISSSKGLLIAFSPEGETCSSEQFSALVGKLTGMDDVSFAIGGSHGLSECFLHGAYKTISFSAMTMPHQLFRIVVLEQLYRSFMIAAGRTYHK